jgi:hypothetical protein
MNPKYPIYIISKGRWESRLTSKALESMSVPYRIVVEPQEYDNYTSVIDPSKILVLPFSNLGQGSIPARNWVWEHSLSEGMEKHWILDDNIESFWRLNRNHRHPVTSGTIFRASEDFVDRYENVGLSGFQYFMFAPSRQKHPAFLLNSRVYSNILIRNDLPYRWRGKYNEDTDLSLRALKDGWCTILFLAFLALKKPTLTMKGGNTDELYHGDKGDKSGGRWEMAESLRIQHPDVVTVIWKWGRWQHNINYAKFRVQHLKLKEGVTVQEGVNNYGMVLVNNPKYTETCTNITLNPVPKPIKGILT